MKKKFLAPGADPALDLRMLLTFGRASRSCAGSASPGWEQGHSPRIRTVLLAQGRRNCRDIPYMSTSAEK